MTDIYVYHFMTGAEDAADTGPKLRATLAAIKQLGEPVMESQIVADHTEVDHDGFLSSHHTFDSQPSSEVTLEIRSLLLRADSRDSAALAMNETTEGQDKYMLQLESRELRNQARKLQAEQNAAHADATRAPQGAMDKSA